MCVLVCVAPPMVVGAWSMAGALQQLFEYYYYYVIVQETAINIGFSSRLINENMDLIRIKASSLVRTY